MKLVAIMALALSMSGCGARIMPAGTRAAPAIRQHPPLLLYPQAR